MVNFISLTVSGYLAAFNELPMCKIAQNNGGIGNHPTDEKWVRIKVAADAPRSRVGNVAISANALYPYLDIVSGRNRPSSGVHVIYGWVARVAFYERVRGAIVDYAWYNLAVSDYRGYRGKGSRACALPHFENLEAYFCEPPMDMCVRNNACGVLRQRHRRRHYHLRRCIRRWFPFGCMVWLSESPCSAIYRHLCANRRSEFKSEFP